MGSTIKTWSIILIIVLCIESSYTNITGYENQQNSTIKPSIQNYSRIIGGSPAATVDWPFMVIVTRAMMPKCGGSLIRENWVLTAAHCFLPEKNKVINKLRFGAAVGVTKLSFKSHLDVSDWMGTDNKRYIIDLAAEVPIVTDDLIPSTSVLIPKNYDTKYLINDIGLMKLKYSVNLSDKIQLVKLTNRKTEPGQKCTTAGFGLNVHPGNKPSNSPIYKNTILYELRLNIMAITECLSFFKKAEKEPLVIFNNTTVIPLQNNVSPILYAAIKKNICAKSASGHSAASSGDSGGPLICEGYQNGIICAVSIHHNILGYLNLYTNISDKIDWINDIINYNNETSMTSVHEDMDTWSKSCILYFSNILLTTLLCYYYVLFYIPI